MSFVSFEFYLFFVGVLALYLLLPHRLQNIFLVIVSYVFYSFWDWRFAFLLLLSTSTDYFCGLAIARSDDLRIKRRYLYASIGIHLTVLALFKYAGFFIGGLDRILTLLGYNARALNLHVLLPIGISFYVFKSLSYTIDVYRGYIKPTNRFLDYALFVAFFPQLAAGPIERADRFLPQIQNRRPFVWDNLKVGLHLIFWGLFKKLVIGDSCAAISDRILSHPFDYSGSEILVGMYAFAFRMYGDISGYTDIARGTAKCMGFNLSINFHLPYFATNISEFWRRWHISVTSWFRDYVFFPVASGTRGNVYLASLLTLLCIAVWHSLSVNSIARGLYFGFIVAAYYLWKRRFHGSSEPHTGNRLMSIVRNMASGLLTFHCVCVGWLFFLDAGTMDIPRILWRVVTDFSVAAFWTNLLWLLQYIWLLVLVQLVQVKLKDELFIVRQHMLLRQAFYLLLFFLVYGAAGGTIIRPFIYFRY